MANDEREAEMLALMRECRETMRRCENTLNEVWAEWTRTHRLSIPNHPLGTPAEPAPEVKKVKRTIRA